MIEVSDVSKWFFRGESSEVRALSDVSLGLSPGEWVTVVGSNGAGKSTLLRIIAGLLLPDRGRVMLNERDVTTWREHRRARWIGRVDQNPLASTAPHMTVAENLAMAMKRGQSRGLRRGVTSARRSLFASALAAVGLGLEERLGALVGTLSGGQRQALALVMATMAKPRVLLLDEHLAALDPKAVEDVLAATTRVISDSSLATLMVTHNMQHAIRCGNRLVMMHQGRIVLDVSGPEKAALTVNELTSRFRAAAGTGFVDDRALLG